MRPAACVAIFVCVFILLLAAPSPTGAQPENDLLVKWTLVQDGIIHKVYEVEIQNLADANRLVGLDTFFSDTSFQVTQLKNVEFYEWKALDESVTVDDYDNVLYENVPIYDDDNNLIGHENRWRWEVVGSHQEVWERCQWKPCKAQWFQQTADTYKEHMGEILIPKFGSKAKYDNFGNVETENGIKRFRLEFDVPIQLRAGGWGSGGKVAIMLDNVEFHPWWDSNWGYKKKITIDNAKVENDFTNFPVLIKLTLDNAKTMDNGDDIAFVDNTDGTQLNHEIESFDTENLVAWVKIPTLYDNENTIIYIYYGNASATNQENVSGTWDDNFVMVQHLSDNSTSTTLDSTSNNNDGTKKAANEPIENDGQIFKAQSFDGTDDNILIPNDLLPANDATISAWFRWSGSTSDIRTIVGFADTYHAMIKILDTDSKIGFYNGFAWLWDTDAMDTDWHQITVTKSSTAGIVLKIDGVTKASNAAATGNFNTSSGQNSYIGLAVDATHPFDGTIDEVRLSNVVRSSGWIVTAFNNEDDPSTFFSVGAEDTGAPNKPTSLLPSARQITVNVTISCVVTDNDGDKENVAFYDNSDNSIIGWDNDVENGAIASVTWSSLTRGNTYTFLAGAQDNNGKWGENSDTRSFYINQTPACSIADPATGASYGVNVGIGFTSSTSDNDNDTLTYSWDFGDGVGTSTDANPNYPYSTVGTYIVELAVNDGYEDSATASIVVNVTGGGGEAAPSGGSVSGGGVGGWIRETVEEIVQPAGTVNVLFLPFMGFPVIFFLAAGIGVSWIADWKGLTYALLLILAFLLVMGARLG